MHCVREVEACPAPRDWEEDGSGWAIRAPIDRLAVTIAMAALVSLTGTWRSSIPLRQWLWLSKPVRTGSPSRPGTHRTNGCVESLAARSRNRKKRDTMCASAACSIRTRSRKDERGVFRGRERARLGHLSEMARCGVGGHTAIKKSIRQRSKQVQFDFYLGGYPEPSNQRICAKNRGFHPVISKAKARNVFRVAPDSRSSPTPTSQILATLSLNETTGAHIRGPGGM